MRIATLLLFASIVCMPLSGDTDVAIGLRASRSEAFAIAKNNGPSDAKDVEFCAADPLTASQFECSERFDLPAGALREFPITTSSGFATFKVTSAESDPLPSNNAVTVAIGFGDFTMIAIPAVARAGESLSLLIGYSASEAARDIHIVSSDPGVVTFPATITIPPGVEATAIAVRALGAGTSLISASNDIGWKSSVSVRVVPAGATASNLSAIQLHAVPAVVSLGSAVHLAIAVNGLTVEGLRPGGTIEVIVDGVPYATIPAGQSDLFIDPLSAGVHTISATYSGDANFFPAASGDAIVTVVRPNARRRAVRH